MNKYLLDTCIFLWMLSGNGKKLGEFIKIIENENNIIFVSIASYWEIMIKKSLGRIEANNDIKIVTEDSGLLWLDIKHSHIDYLEKLPNIHKDPFDRLLISQARVENLIFLTSDERLLSY